MFKKKIKSEFREIYGCHLQSHKTLNDFQTKVYTKIMEPLISAVFYPPIFLFILMIILVLTVPFSGVSVVSVVIVLSVSALLLLIALPLVLLVIINTELLSMIRTRELLSVMSLEHFEKLDTLIKTEKSIKRDKKKAEIMKKSVRKSLYDEGRLTDLINHKLEMVSTIEELDKLCSELNIKGE